MSKVVAAMLPRSTSALEMFHDAARQGHERTCRLLIWRGIDINSTYERPGIAPATALYWAASQGHLQLVRLLIQSGANVNVPNSHGLTPLHEAAWLGCTEIMTELLRAGASPMTLSKFGTTPLHDAVLCNHLEAMSLLIRHGADVCALDLCGNSPLMRACEIGNVECVAYLLHAGADMNQPNVFADTPLHRSVCAGHATVTRLLLLAGANINAKDNRGLTPIDVALKSRPSEDLKLVKLLAYFGAQLHVDTFRLLERRQMSELMCDVDLPEDCLQAAAKEYVLIAEYELYQQSRCPSLKYICRKEIRRLLSQRAQPRGIPLSIAVRTLPVPPQIQRFIVYRNPTLQLPDDEQDM